MNFAQAKQDIEQWLAEVIERPQAALNGWPPCPHARKARLAGEFDLRPGTVNPLVDLKDQTLGDYTVVAYVYDPKTISADVFNDTVDQLNEYLVLRDMLALADHPDDVEEVNGFCMNQGQWAICFLQPLSKLNQAAKELYQKGYYKGWPDAYLDLLFRFREDPRK